MKSIREQLQGLQDDVRRRGEEQPSLTDMASAMMPASAPSVPSAAPPSATPTDAAGGLPSGPASPRQPGIEPATPEEEQQFSVLLANSIDYLWGAGYEEVERELKQAPDPAQGAGTITARTIIEQTNFAKVAGNPISEGLLFEAAGEIVGELFELMSVAGIYNAPNEQAEQQKMLEAQMYAANAYIEDRGNKGLLDTDGILELGTQLRAGQIDPSNKRRPPPVGGTNGGGGGYG